MDDGFCKEGLIDITDKKDINKIRKYWFITYYDDELDDKKKRKRIREELKKFPHLENFVFQVEKSEEKGKHIHIAIGLNDKRSKPVRQFLKIFPDPIIHFIDNNDIKGAREYCSKKYSRIHRPVFHGLDDTEKERLISLGEEDRPIKLMQKTIERQIAKTMAKKRDPEETDFDEEKEVQNIIAKVEKNRTQFIDKGTILILNKMSKRIKKLLNTIEDEDIVKKLDKEDRDIALLINKENKKIHKEDKELIRESAKEITKAVKKKDKHCISVHKKLKWYKEQKKSFEIEKSQLEIERKSILNEKNFNLEIAQAKKSKGQKLFMHEEDNLRKINEKDNEIKKKVKLIRDNEELIRNHPARLEQADKASAISPPSSPVAKIKLKITKVRTIVSLEKELKSAKGQLKIKERFDAREEKESISEKEYIRLSNLNSGYIQTIHDLELKCLILEQKLELSNEYKKNDNIPAKKRFNKG